MEKKIKEGIHLKKKKRFVKQKISGKIFVLMGLAIILAIAAYTFILQSAYTKTALETEISRDRASADAVHKLVDGKIGGEDFSQIKDRSDEETQFYKDISCYLNEIRTLNSTRYIYIATRDEEGETTVLQQMSYNNITPYLVRSRTNALIPIEKTEFLVGKSSECDYQIPDNRKVSRKHCSFRISNGECYIRDENSTNHTYVNGKMIANVFFIIMISNFLCFIESCRLLSIFSILTFNELPFNFF